MKNSCIKVKEKPCKGTGKAKGFDSCGKKTMWRKYGLCSECFRSWLISTPEGDEVIKKHALRASRKIKREQTIKEKEYKEKNKSIAQLKNEARKVFQQWIRMRDADKKCICCDENSETWDAGHYYKAELYTGIIFDEMNVNKQRVYCNQWLGGNEGEYRKGLIKRYGSKAVEDLDERAIATRGKEWTREELNEIKEKYKLKLKNKEL
jgi:hypothetical protein